MRSSLGLDFFFFRSTLFMDMAGVACVDYLNAIDNLPRLVCISWHVLMLKERERGGQPPWGVGVWKEGRSGGAFIFVRSLGPITNWACTRSVGVYAGLVEAKSWNHILSSLYAFSLLPPHCRLAFSCLVVDYYTWRGGTMVPFWLSQKIFTLV